MSCTGGPVVHILVQKSCCYEAEAGVLSNDKVVDVKWDAQLGGEVV